MLGGLASFVNRMSIYGAAGRRKGDSNQIEGDTP
jgi:hypothetical protein